MANEMRRDEPIIPPDMEQYMFEGPIPGQSLTNDPSNRQAWEQPPKFTSVREAREKIFFDLTHPDRIGDVQTLLKNKISINTIAETLLTQGFREGAFNPDMLVQLMEPTMVILLAIAEKSGIRPIVESEGNQSEMDFEDEDIDMDRNARPVSPEIDRMMQHRKNKLIPKGRINQASVGKDIAEKLENLSIEKTEQSLLQKPKPTGEMKSLLAKGE